MAVVINSAVSEASRMNQFHIFCKLTAHQRLYVLWKQACLMLNVERAIKCSKLKMFLLSFSQCLHSVRCLSCSATVFWVSLITIQMWDTCVLLSIRTSNCVPKTLQ